MRKSKTIKMTVRSLSKLQPPPKNASSPSNEWTCAQQANLALAHYKSGAMAWRFKAKLGDERINMTRGRYPTWGIDEAIEWAREMRRLVDQGIDPRYHTNGNDDVTLRDFVTKSFKPHVKKHYKSWKNAVGMLNKRIVKHFGDRKLKAIAKKEVGAFHRALTEEISGTTANRYLALLSSLYKMAIEEELVEINPARGVKKAPENKSRDRYLHADEFERFIKVLEANLHKPSYQLIFILIALGPRSGELKDLRWSDVNLSDATLYLHDTKNGESRYVAVNSVALDLLTNMHKKRRRSSPWVFPSKKGQSGHLVDIRHPFKAICEAAKIKNIRPHDLRRSHATQLLNAGVDVMIVKEILGHKSLRSTQVYARVTTSSMAKSSEIASAKIREAMNG